MDTAILRELEGIVGRDNLLSSEDELRMYEYDGSVEIGRPDCVVFPGDKREVVEIARLSSRRGVPIVGRGAGTGLSGGALAREGGVQVVFSRMNRILSIDAESQLAVVEPGVVNLELSRAVAGLGLHFAPDPSSQKSSTIGGNVSENAGGPHTLAYGVTTNHVLGMEIVLPSGESVRIGGGAVDPTGYDLPGLLVGSEGTLALIVEITVRLTPLPETIKTLLAVFETTDDATETVAALTAGGITPAACEMLDGWTIRVVESWIHVGLPTDAAALLLIDIDGLIESAEGQAAAVAEIARRNHAREVRVARDAAEREGLWKARKNAFGAVGRIAPDCYVQDGVIPRTRLPDTLRRIAEIGRRHGFEIGNIFHAGDGNLHPLICFDGRDPAQREHALAASNEIIALCVEFGGSITGEHGVGMEKDRLMPLLFSPADLDVMKRVRSSFNPAGLLNPGKIFPGGKSCGEIRVPALAPSPQAGTAPSTGGRQAGIPSDISPGISSGTTPGTTQ
ncbi:MAG TPA: FAD-linked oxidase C-terminal domain-containing protein [Candidatus Dormibacteraeota bacterium]|nr:FAD-linked oxidase C-terminal domain-containing protein [Candidatus Dormibacteraeota bacterium]